LPATPDRFAADKAPDVGVEAAGFFLYFQKGPGVLDRRVDLLPVADDAGVDQ